MNRFILDARTATAHFPGIGRTVRNLAPALAAQLAPDEALILLWNSRDPSAWNPTPLAGPQVTPIPAPVSPFALGQQWTLPRLLRQAARGQADSRRLQSAPRSVARSPALYHSPYYLMPYRPGLPTVVTLYDLIPLLFPETVSWRARLLFRLATRLALGAARHVITISQASRQDLLAHFPLRPQQVTAIPLAPEAHFHPQPQAEVARVRQKLGLPEEHFLYLGINKPHKNLLTLVEAFAQAKAQGPTPPLTIAGAWDRRYPQARRRVQELGMEAGVRFLGPVAEADLPGLYSSCTAFLFPSRYEGFGLPVLEAMACGAPVICAHTSSLPEVAGEAALFFHPDRPEELAAQLRRLLDDPALARALSQRSLDQAARFSWKETARQTLTIYRELTG